MSHKRYDQLSIVDKFIGPGRSRSDQFFAKVDAVVDWAPIEAELNVIHASRRGRPGKPPLLMFKTLLVQRFYNLSDPATQDALNDRKSFARFVGLPLDEAAPDYSSISRFRTELVRLGLMEKLLGQLMAQIEKKGLVLKEGTLMDATFVASAVRPPSAPRKPNRAKHEDRSGDPSQPPQNPFAAGKRSRRDPDAPTSTTARSDRCWYSPTAAPTTPTRDTPAGRCARSSPSTPCPTASCSWGPSTIRSAPPPGGATNCWPGSEASSKASSASPSNGWVCAAPAISASPKSSSSATSSSSAST
jgi:IS5 family transposase